MSETQDVMKMMVNYIDRQNKYFCNLLEVLADELPPPNGSGF